MGNQWSRNRGRQPSPWAAPLELIDRSSINDNDLIANLRWSLTEAMRWDERAIAIKDIICVEGSAETKNLSKSQQEERYFATLELLDNILHDGSQITGPAASSSATKAKESVKALFTTKSSETAQQRSTAGAPSTGVSEQGSPSLSPPSSGIQGCSPLPPSSSKLFAAAACKFVISSINDGGPRTTWLGSESRSKISEVMSPMQKTIATESSPRQQPIGGIQSGQETNVLPAEAAIESVECSRKSLTAFPHDEIVEPYHNESMNERVEIACKYIYLSSLMKSLSHSSAWCYQLHEKIKWFNNSISELNVPTTKEIRQQYSHRELQKKQMELAKDRVYSLLDDGLKSHDRWRCVLRLLYRDFELCLTKHKLLTEIARWCYCRDNQQLGGVWTNEMEEKITTLNAQKQPLELEVEKNERDAMSCGLAFLDKNLSGSLEAEETPELNAKLFSLLDIQHRAAISYTDLHKRILSIQEKLETINAKIQMLNQQNEELKQRATYAQYQSAATSGIASSGGADSVVIIENGMEIERLKRESLEHWNNLQQIYSAFFTAFSTSIFPSVQLNELDHLQKNILAKGDQMIQIIDHISKLSGTDPLISMQTKLQRGDVSLTSQAALDAAIIAQSQHMPLAAAKTPLTIPMTLSTPPATEHHPPSSIEQTIKPKSEMEVLSAEQAGDVSKRELHPSMEENIGAAKDIHTNIQAERERAREKASEMRSSHLENVPPQRTDIPEKRQTTESTVHEPAKDEPKKERSEEYPPPIRRQTALGPTPPTSESEQQKDLPYEEQTRKYQDDEENLSRRDYVEKPSSLTNIPPPSAEQMKGEQGYGDVGGYDPSRVRRSEESESIPPSPERQSRTWSESIKDTVRNVTGSQTGTH